MKTTILLLSALLMHTTFALAEDVKCEKLVDKVLGEDGLGSFWHPKFDKKSGENSVYFYGSKDDAATKNIMGVDVRSGGKPTFFGVLTTYRTGPIKSFDVGYDPATCMVNQFVCFAESGSSPAANPSDCQKYYKDPNTKFTDLGKKLVESTNPCVSKVKHLCDVFKAFIPKAPTTVIQGSSSKESSKAGVAQ